MRILITGIAGFAARHFLNYLHETEPGSEVAGIYNHTTPSFSIEELPELRISLFKADLTDRKKVEEIICDYQPEYILHLAGRSSVAESWNDPAGCMKDNTDFFLNITETVRLLHPKCRILSVGSAEEYGNTNIGKPLKETDCPEPAGPYGVARVLQQKMVKIYACSYGLDIVHTRSFNHFGPYQQPAFVLSSFAKQVVQQDAAGKKMIELKTGDINVVRDFSDVRDVVRAYYMLLLKGKKGETYNVCSGEGHVLRDVIDMLAEIIGKPVHYSTDEKNFRPSENKTIIGSYQKLEEETGWKPAISMKESLTDLIAYHRRHL